MTLKRVIVGLIAVALVSLASLYGLYRLINARCFALTGPAICRVQTEQPLVALTLDDGPTEQGVAAVLPVLDAYGARATFFMVGNEARVRPHLVAQVAAAGHEIGNHSMTHARLLLRPAAVYDAEIGGAQNALREAGGAAPVNFRPPYGDKLVGLPLAAKRAGLPVIMWDIADPETSDPAIYARQIVEAARPGSIILMHPMYPANETARQALPAMLEGLHAKGLRVVTVRELMAARSGGEPR